MILLLGMPGGAEWLFILIVIIGLIIIPMWKVYEKAGKPGWASIVPIYNYVVFLEIINKPWWWVILFMIPYLNIIWLVWSWNLMVKRFGKSEAFTIGVVLLPFIFIPILGYGDSKFQPIDSNENLESI